MPDTVKDQWRQHAIGANKARNLRNGAIIGVGAALVIAERCASAPADQVSGRDVPFALGG